MNILTLNYDALRCQKCFFPDICTRSVLVTDAARSKRLIAKFIGVCLVAWPLSGSEAGVDIGLIQTFLFFLFKPYCSYTKQFLFSMLYI